MTISIQDYTQWVHSINTTATTAFSDFLRSMQHTSAEIRSGLISREWKVVK